MDHTNHVRLATAELTPAVLEGATVYGADDHQVGTVDHVHGAGAGSQAIIDVGGFLGIGEDFVHEGILGTTWTGRIVEETLVGPHAAVVPTLTGRAWITGYSEFVVDPDDPFPAGFTVGDLWSAGP